MERRWRDKPHPVPNLGRRDKSVAVRPQGFLYRHRHLTKQILAGIVGVTAATSRMSWSAAVIEQPLDRLVVGLALDQSLQSLRRQRRADDADAGRLPDGTGLDVRADKIGRPDPSTVVGRLSLAGR